MRKNGKHIRRKAMAKIDDCLLEIENLLNKRRDLVLVDYFETKIEDDEIYKVHHLRIESKEEYLPMPIVPIEVWRKR